MADFKKDIQAYYEKEETIITSLNIDELKQLARDPEVLINKLDILFTHGQLSPRTRNIIKTALDYLIHGDFREDRVRLAVYLICISPDYSILK